MRCSFEKEKEVGTKNVASERRIFIFSISLNFLSSFSLCPTCPVVAWSCRDIEFIRFWYEDVKILSVSRKEVSRQVCPMQLWKDNIYMHQVYSKVKRIYNSLCVLKLISLNASLFCNSFDLNDSSSLINTVKISRQILYRRIMLSILR